MDSAKVKNIVNVQSDNNNFNLLPNSQETTKCTQRCNFNSEIREEIGKSNRNLEKKIKDSDNFEKIAESKRTNINGDVGLIPPESSRCFHPTKERSCPNEAYFLSNPQEVFQGLEMNTNMKYIDDQTKEGIACRLKSESGNLHNQSMSKFIVYDNILSNEVNESILQDISQDNINMKHDNDYFIFSTTLSKLSSKSAIWEDINPIDTWHQDQQEELTLDCDVSLIMDMSSDIHSISEQRHSTPIKNKHALYYNDNSSLDSESDNDDDDDIEENYLETVWMTNRIQNLPSCGLLVKCLKRHQEDKFSQSMIYNIEELDLPLGEPSCLSYQNVESNYPRALSSNLKENMRGGTETYIINESISLVHQGGITSSGTSMAPSVGKMSYKDKLMEGLQLDTMPTNAGLSNIVKELVVATPDMKESSLLHVYAKSGRDENHNLVSSDFNKLSYEHSKDSMRNSKKSDDVTWNEQRSKKSAAKRTHCSLGSTSKKEVDRTEDSLKSINSSKFPSKEINFKEFMNKVEHSFKDEVSGLSKNKLLQTKNLDSQSSDILEDNKNCDEKSLSQKRRSRKLKKFCSLDLSELRETADAKIKKINKKWQSHNDLNEPSSLKADNYLLWPLLGLAFFAGFVAFCFRDKISFMIASRFPFERPPI